MIELPRRPLPPVEAMLPLINVAFLLMAFFMLIGRMDTTAPFEVMPPRSNLGTPLPQGGVTVSVSASGALALNGEPRSADEIVDMLASEAGAANTAFVRINADREAPVGRILPLVGKLEARGVRRVALVVTSEVAQER